MVKERKHYVRKLDGVVAEKAFTAGLVRDFPGWGEFVGYLVIQKDDGGILYEITLRGENGLFNLITKSENVIKQLDELIEATEGEPRESWLVSFTELKTKKGNNYISVNVTTKNDLPDEETT